MRAIGRKITGMNVGYLRVRSRLLSVKEGGNCVLSHGGCDCFVYTEWYVLALNEKTNTEILSNIHYKKLSHI